jgi:mxaJ protein
MLKTTFMARALAVACGALFCAPAVRAEGILRICAAENEPPYSSRDGQGFENRIAVAVAEAMGRKAEFVWSSQPAIYLVRDYLDKGLCDVVTGLDEGDQRVLTTKAYYRTGYAFLTRTDSRLDISSWRSPDLARAEHIGFVPGSPAQVMLEELGLFSAHFNYMHSLTDFQDRRNRYIRIDPKRMVGELIEGKADVMVNFAPELARYAKSSATPLRLTLIPDDARRSDGKAVPQHFSQSMGVRKDDAGTLAELDAGLQKAGPKIEEILREESIPLAPLPAAAPSRS